MDPIAADLALQAILGRGADFVGGIDNGGMDFSDLQDFINSDGSQGNGTYFAESLNSTSATGKLLNVIVENKRNTAGGHSLPESPPDSSSEHPYSPQDTCEQLLSASDSIYGTLGQNLYKPTLLNPILPDNLILGSHIVVAEQNNDQQLLDNTNLLTDGRIIVNEDLRPNGTSLLNTRLLSEGIQPDTSLMQERILLNDENNRQLLLQNGDSNQNYATERSLYGKNEENGLVHHLGYNHSIDVPLSANNLESNICEQNLDSIQTVYTNLQNVSKKRKLSQDSPLVKSEPEHCTASQSSPSATGSTAVDDDYASSEACLSESQYQCIRFTPFQQNQWHSLCDQNLTELAVPHYRVDADKGFNFSNADDAFVCQKKNHFQITCHVQLLGDAHFVKTAEGLQKISSFHLHFYGVKHDCPTQTIRVEQSQSDRSKKPFHPVLVELVNSQVTKVTVGRLHFSETTSNNMRKKGKPNPEQRYFQLVVGLHAHTSSGNFPVISHASQKIIVRASNPGQFESDVELCWQKGQTVDSVCHTGKVGINTDRPDEALVIHGNIKVTGHIIQPSDIRAKKNIVECNTAEQLKNVQRIRVVKYEYEPEFASQLNRCSESSDTGVIAQEVAEILPEAVSPAGDLVLEDGTSIDNFLVVNKERIFMENIGAVKELCKVTDNLETRIDQLERINRRLSKLKRGDSLKSTSTVNSLKHSHSHKCLKHHHSCEKEDELCSNKFIQIVIVILVLIMAFCLAAITTLYLIEAARHNHFVQVQTSLEAATKPSPITKRPTKYTPYNNWQSVLSHHTTETYRIEDVSSRITIDSSLIKKISDPIGRPPECLSFDQDLESTNLCQIFCCPPTPVINPQEITSSFYSEKKPSLSMNKTTPLFNVEKNKIKPFHSNDIDKQVRQRRDTSHDIGSDNAFHAKEDPTFRLFVQGKNFNATLTNQYLSSVTDSYNFSYSVPISKYMPDDYISLIFCSAQPNIRQIEHCYTDYKELACRSSMSLRYEDKPHVRHKENSPGQLLCPQSVIFEIEMVDFQSKVLTYRASLQQNQNACKLPSSQLGVEFVEYNFLFFRHCEE